ncbi:hypothetical protein RRG08_031414 [Elysia crispata]|uniref:Uncharacterized protein n=1 Tax=Elysia crispata TaxID=231223 RepID=A0AAE0ZND0_9GAST|nr:hypothetical protein RRG08_031414 [Elysia crispata]
MPLTIQMATSSSYLFLLQKTWNETSSYCKGRREEEGWRGSSLKTVYPVSPESSSADSQGSSGQPEDKATFQVFVMCRSFTLVLFRKTVSLLTVVRTGFNTMVYFLTVRRKSPKLVTDMYLGVSTCLVTSHRCLHMPSDVSQVSPHA